MCPQPQCHHQPPPLLPPSPLSPISQQCQAPETPATVPLPPSPTQPLLCRLLQAMAASINYVLTILAVTQLLTWPGAPRDVATQEHLPEHEEQQLDKTTGLHEEEEEDQSLQICGLSVLSRFCWLWCFVDVLLVPVVLVWLRRRVAVSNCHCQQGRSSSQDEEEDDEGEYEEEEDQDKLQHKPDPYQSVAEDTTGQGEHLRCICQSSSQEQLPDRATSSRGAQGSSYKELSAHRDNVTDHLLLVLPQPAGRLQL